MYDGVRNVYTRNNDDDDVRIHSTRPTLTHCTDDGGVHIRSASRGLDRGVRVMPLRISVASMRPARLSSQLANLLDVVYHLNGPDVRDDDLPLSLPPSEFQTRASPN